MTFIRLLDSLIFEYRNEKYNDARSLRKVQMKMRKDEAEAEALKIAEKQIEER